MALTRTDLRTIELTRPQALPIFDFLLRTVLVLNIVDLAFTIFYIESGQAVEANPVMAMAYAVSPVLFAAVKIALVSMGILLLHRLRRTLTARYAIVTVSAAYAAVVVYHLAHFSVPPEVDLGAVTSFISLLS